MRTAHARTHTHTRDTAAHAHAPRVGQLGLHEEVLGALGGVKRRLARHALDLLQLARLGRGLDVLEVHLGEREEEGDVRVWRGQGGGG